MKKIFFLLLIFVFLLGCSSTPEDIKSEETDFEFMEEKQSVIIETNKGSFTVLLYEDTPLTTANFISLVESKFYNGLSFHRYEAGFVIQGGDPNGDGTGGSEKMIPLEVVGRSHTRGTLGMARSSEPDSASSQFFVNLANNTFLDEGYAVFGEVTEGMNVVDTLRAGDTILSIQVFS